MSKDGKVYTFALRKGVKFHNKPPVNGREVTAEDVKYSLERFMAKSGFATRFEPVSAIDVVDKHTVRITLKEPYAPFLNHLANPSFCVILPREAEEKFKDFNHPDAVIGTGPFVLKSYEKGVRVVFERNPDYFMKGMPYLDGAVIEITPDAAARVAVLRAGQGRPAAHLGLGEPGGSQGPAEDQSRAGDHAPPGHRPGLHLHADGSAALQRHQGAARRVAGHRSQGVERRTAVRRGLHRRRSGAVRAQGVEARGVQDRRRPRPST